MHSIEFESFCIQSRGFESEINRKVLRFKLRFYVGYEFSMATYSRAKSKVCYWVKICDRCYIIQIML